MRVQREWLEELIFRGEASRRFTQDSPILPDVWVAFVVDPPASGRVDLLFTPHRSQSTAELYLAMQARLDAMGIDADSADARHIAYNQSSVVARLTLQELLEVVLPLSTWWREHVDTADRASILRDMKDADGRVRLREALQRATVDVEQTSSAQDRSTDAASVARKPAVRPRYSGGALWLLRLVGAILLAGEESEETLTRARFFELTKRYDEIIAAVATFVADMPDRGENATYPLYSVSRNRPVRPTISRSVMSVKADAARRLFEIDASDIGWAVIDSGVDATHPAFRTRDPKTRQPYPEAFEGKGQTAKLRSRVVRTFDLTKIREILRPGRESESLLQYAPASRTPARRKAASETLEGHARDLTNRISSGRNIDWDELIPLLEMPHDGRYDDPAYEHGTHVAGVLGANWCRKDWPDNYPEDELSDAIGVCPDVKLYDFRVLDDRGEGNEFTVMAALQLIRHLNATRERPMIHGANLSLALRHDVANYACGRTPVCDECSRLVASGTVVVTAAGNDGYSRVSTPEGSSDGYRSISIADPGNADSVITVGATHRFSPHTYGVSYFSSRGPTGDGRIKPDLVAPGEKITAPIPGGRLGTKDGTSMAAPHVSGVAVLLMARHRELIGNPARVKQILCSTATDLGRERYFQGAGMVDALRALQAV